MICIACPIGCRLTVGPGSSGSLVVSGNSCPRGIEYGTEEYSAPKRIVTATLAVTLPGGGRIPELRLPVKTDRPFPKELIPGLLAAAYGLEVPLPVASGDMILTDIQGTGVNLVATKALSSPKTADR